MLYSYEEGVSKYGSKYQTLFTSSKPANPFTPKTEKDTFEDLEESRKQLSEGKGIDMKQALEEMGARHGFV